MNPEQRPTLAELAAQAQEQMSEEEGGGLRCPNCGCRDFRVVRVVQHVMSFILRRRECRHCGKRITTSERVIGGGK